MTEQKTYTAGQKVGAGKFVCIDCGKELTLDKSEQDLRKSPSCACEEYQCFPMTHIRPQASPFRSRGRLGVHTEHMGHLLSELQYLQRAYPNAPW